MSSQDPGAAVLLCPADTAEGPFDAGPVIGHGRRQEGRHPRLRQHRLDCRQSFFIFIHRIGTGTAVDVFIDESRHDKSAIGINEVGALAQVKSLAGHDIGNPIPFVQQNMSAHNGIGQDDHPIYNRFHHIHSYAYYLWQIWVICIPFTVYHMAHTCHLYCTIFSLLRK